VHDRRTDAVWSPMAIPVLLSVFTMIDASRRGARARKRGR